MKSEERHQLLTNDLGVVTTKTVGFFERHLETVIATVCAVVIFGAAIFWWNQSAQSDSAAGWTLLDAAKNLQDFGNVADRFKGKAPGQWATLKIAEKTSQNALPLMFTNRELAKAELKSAREGFESLIKDHSAPSIVRERSLWGLALCLEALCDGDTSKPIEAYEHLITNFPDTIFKSVAEERVVALKKADAKEFYEWFSKEDPKPPEARPEEFKKGGVELPSPKFGEGEEENKDIAEKKDAAAEKTETPEASTDKAPDSKEPAEKSGEEKSSDPAKPVEGEKATGTEPAKEGDKPNEKD
jgi:hypothetical protein